MAGEEEEEEENVEITGQLVGAGSVLPLVPQPGCQALRKTLLLAIMPEQVQQIQILVLEETVWKSCSISERYCGILQMIS